MYLKYYIESLSYANCRTCSKKLIKNLSALPFIKKAHIDLNHQTIEIESDDMATKEEIDSIVALIEKESYCERHDPKESRDEFYSYSDKCGKMDEAKMLKELNEEKSLGGVRLDTTKKFIQVTSKSNINTYMILQKVIKNIDDDVTIQVIPTRVKRLSNEPKIYKIISYCLSLIFLVLGIIFKNFYSNKIYELFAFIFSYLFLSFEIFYHCFKEIKNKNIFNEELLMIVASIGAFFIWEGLEAIILSFVYLIGEYIEDKVSERSEKAIQNLINFKVDEVRLESGQIINIEDVLVGDVILVRKGEEIPLDGIVKSGSSLIDTKRMTGEALPLEVSNGSEVISGCINLDSPILIEVTKLYHESNVYKMMELISFASKDKSKVESFVQKFSKYYTPIVMALSIIVFIIEYFLIKMPITESLNNSLVFLVISCPCGIILSVPLAFLVGRGRLSKDGIIIKGNGYLEMMNELKTLVFDKTNTITEGNFKVQNLILDSDIKKEECLKIISSLEAYSTHPIAKILFEYAKNYYEPGSIKNIKEEPGIGLFGNYHGSTVSLGGEALLKKLLIPFDTKNGSLNIIYLVIDNKLVCHLELYDCLKPNSISTLSYFKKRGIKLMMLSGDSIKNTNAISKMIGADEAHGSLLPKDKLEYLHKYLKTNKKGKVAYIGDGINDTPSIKLADIGIAIGQNSSDSAKEAADVVVLKDDIKKVEDYYIIARKSYHVALFNIILTLSVKLISMIIVLSNVFSSLSGFLMTIGLLSDVGVTIIAILNSARILNYKIK